MEVTQSTLLVCETNCKVGVGKKCDPAQACCHLLHVLQHPHGSTFPGQSANDVSCQIELLEHAHMEECLKHMCVSCGLAADALRWSRSS
jgi:hypothetical protein